MDSLNGIRLPAREDLLARDIAQTLGDERNFRKYRHCAERYDESSLREALSQVKQTPPERIKKSRAALFFYLIHHNAKRTA